MHGNQYHNKTLPKGKAHTKCALFARELSIP